jgi:hypothetical protein
MDKLYTNKRLEFIKLHGKRCLKCNKRKPLTEFESIKKYYCHSCRWKSQQDQIKKVTRQEKQWEKYWEEQEEQKKQARNDYIQFWIDSVPKTNAVPKVKLPVILKCSTCSTTDRLNFSPSRVKHSTNTKAVTWNDIYRGYRIRMSICKKCQKKSDAEQRQLKNKIFDPTRIIRCPVCNKTGDLSSNLFAPNKYKQAKYICKCKHCRRNDPKAKIYRNIRRRLKDCFTINILQRTNNPIKVRIQIPTEEVVGCTSEELKLHFESKFQEGMTWDNYGEWHIDHIVPMSKFNLVTDNLKLNKEEAMRSSHYTNLQPLWAADNLTKSDKILDS